MKDIKGYEGLYAVTSCGKVWGYKRKKFLTPIIEKDGRARVGLTKNGKQKMFLVHRLVADTYIPNPDNLPQVNHKDENPLHNWVDNLEWCDNKYNCNYGTRIDRVANGHKKQIYCVELNKTFDGVINAAKELEIDASHIVKVCKGKKQTAHGYHFKYKEVS